MVALLLKTTQENSALTTHFGKAKAFGLFDPATGKIGVFKNENSTGNALIKELKAHNVTDLIVQGMGANPYAAAKESGMKIWFAGTDRMTLNEAIENFKAQTLTLSVIVPFVGVIVLLEHMFIFGCNQGEGLGFEVFDRFV